jgi:hypothetical protein
LGVFSHFPHFPAEFFPNGIDERVMKPKRSSDRCISKGKYDLNIRPNNAPRKHQNHLSKPLSDSKFLSGEENATKWVFVPIKIIFRRSISKKMIEKPIVGCEEDETSERCTKAVVIVQSMGNPP